MSDYDLNALRAARDVALNSPDELGVRLAREVFFSEKLFKAATESTFLDDAALGRAVRAAAEGKNPDLLFALVQGYQSVPSLAGYEAKAEAAARALVAKGGK